MSQSPIVGAVVEERVGVMTAYRIMATIIIEIMGAGCVPGAMRKKGRVSRGVIVHFIAEHHGFLYRFPAAS